MIMKKSGEVIKNALSSKIPAATLSCVCQKVSISIAEAPCNRLQCCCMDCRKALQWCDENWEKSSSSSPLLFINATYFPNAISVDKGLEHLESYLIRENYNTRRIVATCCGTPLIGDHPIYRGKKFITYIPPAELTLRDGVESMPPQRRIFQEDLSPDEQSMLPPFTEPSVKTDIPTSKIEQERLDALYSEGYVSLQSLIDDKLPPIKYMDPEYDGKDTSWNKSFPDGPYY